MFLKLWCISACFLALHILSGVHSGDVTISYSPSSLRFGSAGALHISDLDDVIATAMGYTPEMLTWPGLTVTSAFDYPSATIIFGIRDAGVPVKMEGMTYDLKEDISLAEGYESITDLIGARAQRPIHFDKINIHELIKQLQHVNKPSLKYLNEKHEIDLSFLQEMVVLPTLADYVKGSSSVADNGQDIVLIEINSFSPLVKKYGQDSPEVKEAKKIMRAALEQTIYSLRTFYSDRLLVASAMLSQESKVRRKRDALTFGEETKNQTKYNLASEYREDFPVVFNIVLILSIILIVSIIAVSASMAYMDPGRDSIIYRMTNPRMKKDQ